MDQIRIANGEKRIEVNDNGEYIVLPLGDCTFPVRYFDMLDRINAAVTEMQAEAEVLDKQLANMTLTDQLRKKYDFDLKLHERIKGEFDTLFGEGTCRKVFGDIVPSIDLYDDFLSQLTPFFTQYAKQRAEKMNRYSEAREGNV